MAGSPLLDRRTASTIAEQVRRLQEQYVGTAVRTGPGDALTRIFARYAEIIIQRLNRVPEKNFLAFLDLLGTALLPPQPARVPVTFFLAAGSPTDGVVPAGTQVASPPGPGEKEPVVFETEREVVVTAAQLVSLFVREPEADKYADLGQLASAAAWPAPEAFAGLAPIEHILYLGHPALLGHADLRQLRLDFALSGVPAAPDPRSLNWERWDGASWLPLAVQEDTTASLARDGSVVFDGFPPAPYADVGPHTSRWLRCRLLTPITPSAQGKQGMVRAGHLPTVHHVTLSTTRAAGALPGDAAFTNQLPLDLSKDFFPLGEKPRFGDLFYFASAAAFSDADAEVALAIELTNPAKSNDAESPIPPVLAAGRPALQWEFWDGQRWAAIGRSEWVRAASDQPFTFRSAPAASNEFKDETEALTAGGAVRFTFPGQPVERDVNGVQGFWLRARLIGGDYGKDASYGLKEPERPEAGFIFVPATLAPPSIRTLAIGYRVAKPAVPATLLAYNDFSYEEFSTASSFKPFRATADARPSLYLGFTLPAGRSAFPNRPLSLYLRTADVLYTGPAPGPAPGAPDAPPRLAWHYWNGLEWAPVTARDETAALTRPGLVEVLLPATFTGRTEFGLARYWLRVVWESGQYRFVPKLRRVLLNTTMAAQAVTVRDEILGSSDAGANLALRAARTPILPGQRLIVREPEEPSADERAVLEREEGADAVAVTRDAAGSPVAIWTRWHEVPDFYASGPRDRHYVLDHLSGEIRFGDGLNGLPPPVGVGNIRLAHYRVGGGAAGNRPAGAVIQLKTTVPYVDKVGNYEPATGGADAEAVEALLERAPRAIRHRERAVTVEDYADLAKLASPAVARVLAVPLLDLGEDPIHPPTRPGVVSVIVVPQSADDRPMPSLELIARVQDYLTAHCMPTVAVRVVGPQYVRVDVTAEIALASLEGAGQVEQSVVQALTRFLHPITGGLDGTGWDFGREPHLSDFYALIETIPGIDHVRMLSVGSPVGSDSVRDTRRFLVYSGTHAIKLDAERF